MHGQEQAQFFVGMREAACEKQCGFKVMAEKVRE